VERITLFPHRVLSASNGPDALGVPETLRESRALGLFYGQAILCSHVTIRV
jgi:hypothetical protein